MTPLADALNIALCIASAALALCMRAWTGGWASPAALLAGYWTLVTAACLALGRDFRVSPGALAWIVLALFCFATGGLAAAGINKGRTGTAATPRAVRTFGAEALAAACVAIGAVAAIAVVVHSDRHLAQLLSYKELVAMANELTVARYTGDQLPRSITALFAALYLGGLTGGFLAATAHSTKARILSWLPLVPALAITVMTTTKATLLIAIACWLSGNLAARVASGTLVPWTPGRRLRSVAGAAAFTILFVWLVGLRYGLVLDEYSTVLPRLRVYFFGELAVFSAWFDASWHSVVPSPGMLTFAGIADALGLVEREAGLFTDFVDLNGYPSNVYTAFRPLIEDFGAAGALLTMGAVGYAAQKIFIHARRANPAAATCLAALYAVLFLSPVTMVTVYNSVLLAFSLSIGVGLLSLRTRRARAAANLADRQHGLMDRSGRVAAATLPPA
jgi:hypothetical protein